MKSSRIFILILFILTSPVVSAQQIQVIRYHDLKKMLNKQNDTTYIFNFWATWCKPCVKELPYFDSVAKKYESDNVKVILISLDLLSQLNLRLVPFIKAHQIVSEILLLNEPDYNSWIPDLNATWSGAIPATFVINNKRGVRNFYEREFSLEELEKTIESVIY